jgi:hypothetical protein
MVQHSACAALIPQHAYAEHMLELLLLLLPLLLQHRFGGRGARARFQKSYR